MSVIPALWIEAEAGGGLLQVQGQPGLHSKDSLNYVARPCLKIDKQKTLKTDTI